jgi:hypothetical protein
MQKFDVLPIDVILYILKYCPFEHIEQFTSIDQLFGKFTHHSIHNQHAFIHMIHFNIRMNGLEQRTLIQHKHVLYRIILSQCSHLELSEASFDFADFLKQLNVALVPNLQGLYLDECDLDGYEFRNLIENEYIVPKVRRLLVESSVCYTGEPIAKFINLQYLSINFSWATSDSFIPVVCSLMHLITLRLISSHFSKVKTRELLENVKCKKLLFENPKRRIRLDGIENNKIIKTLHICDYKNNYTSNDLLVLNMNTYQLEKLILDLHEFSDDQVFDNSLGHNQRLVSLDVAFKKINTLNLSPVSRMSNLQYLTVLYENIDIETLKNLARVPTYKPLYISVIDLRHLSSDDTVKELQSVCCSQTQIYFKYNNVV